MHRILRDVGVEGESGAWNATPRSLPSMERNIRSRPVFLPGESQGRGSLVACRLWGHTELDMTEAQRSRGKMVGPGAAASPAG